MAPALALDIPSARKSRSARLGQLQVPPDSFSSQPTAGTESEEFDFSDVFGPIPPPHAVHQLASVDEGVELADWGPPELHFDSETLVICSRSHSLVGPSPRPSLSRQLSKFSFDEDNSFKGKRQAAAFSLDPKENIAPDAEINSNISNSPLEVDASVSSVNSRDAEKPKEKLGPQDFELSIPGVLEMESRGRDREQLAAMKNEKPLHPIALCQR
ncbi:hypothetical protein O6H91_15G002000 [Diphasiastrum complanatum]|uniref:Uncharacterized protein n=2 Tax=Diphasiastrum complanatum TaxID=34168 RepID=A0ACC2BEZ6_DIPCM|nr:hypothetical protein O6H91_15G001600 [Diphasiastrum complanatum]KAJ7528391.1 hypothetical protein O6H91_15G002000 [Diphasiastrum complanatum]